jgi:hypothetical protein
MFGKDNTRDWNKRDESNDRAVTEAPVSQEHWNRNEDRQVDAVPGCRWRPGSRN